MRAIEILKKEHRTIERGLELLEKAAERPESEDALQALLEFLSEFADRRHHAKEEDILFAALEKQGMPREGGPIFVMLEEHQIGRSLRKQMAEALSRFSAGDGGQEGFVRAARSFVMLLRQHIEKEDNILYPLAENLLGSDADPALLDEFEAADRHWGQSARRSYSHLIPEVEQFLK